MPRVASSRTGHDDEPQGRRLWALVPVFVPLLVYVEGLLGQKLLAPGDGHSYYLALRTLTSRLWRQGVVPSWDPYAFAGSPLLALHQPAVLYPPNLVLVWVPPILAHNLVVVGSVVLAGCGTFLLCRRLGSDRPGAAIAGVVFALSGAMFGHVAHTALLATVAWLPWVLWGFERLREELSPTRLLVSASTIAMSVLAGHGQILAWSLVSLAVYGGALVLLGPSRVRTSLLMVLLVGTGLALAAVQLVPVLAVLGETARVDLTFDEAVAYSHSPSSSPLLLFPYLFGNHLPSGPFTAPYRGEWSLTELSSYLGAGAVVLATVGLTRTRLAADRRLLALLLVAAVSTVVAFGDSTPVARLVHGLPYLGQFRAWGRYLVGLHLAVAVFAGLGWTELRTRRSPREGPRRATVAAVALVAVAALVAGLPALRGERVGGAEGALALGLPVVAALATVMVVRWRCRTREGLPALVALVVIGADLLAFGAFFRWRDHSPSPAEARALLASGVAPSWGAVDDAPGGIDRFLFASEDPLRAAPWYQRVLDAKGVRAVTGFDPLAPRRFMAAVGDMEYRGGLQAPERVLRPSGHVLDLLRVSTIVMDVASAERSLPGPGRGRPVAGNLVRFDRRPGLEDAFLVGEARSATAEEAEEALVGEERFDPGATALVEGACPVCAQADRPGPAGVVTARRWNATSMEFEVDSLRPAVLVVSSAWFPGWRAEVDGAEAPVARTDGLVLGVPVPLGRHLVRLAYQPPGLVTGAVVSGSTLLALAGWGAVRRYRQDSNQMRRSSSAFGASVPL